MISLFPNKALFTFLFIVNNISWILTIKCQFVDVVAKDNWIGHEIIASVSESGEENFPHRSIITVND